MWSFSCDIPIFCVDLFSIRTFFFQNIYLFGCPRSWLRCLGSLILLAAGHVGSVPWPGTGPLHWEHRVLATGPWGKLLTSFVWLNFFWKREKRQTSTSEYGVLQPWWSCRNSGEEAERSWKNDKWNCGQSFLGPQALPSALSPQPLRTWLYRLPLGWGLVLSEKLHSEDTVCHYIVRQTIDIIWNLQWTPGLKGNRICFGEKEPRSAGSN